MEKVTLLYEWIYTAHGWREYDVILRGRAIGTFTFDSMESLRKQMKERIQNQHRKEAEEELPTDETIEYEKIEIYNIREATRWTELEDFNSV
jgi:hypothetical protein